MFPLPNEDPRAAEFQPPGAVPSRKFDPKRPLTTLAAKLLACGNAFGATPKPQLSREGEKK